MSVIYIKQEKGWGGGGGGGWLIITLHVPDSKSHI